MFKNIQKFLLLNHPLLWNTKIIPGIVFTILFHFIFFGIGYLNGKVDFQETYSYNYGIEDGIVVFFSVIITILFFIIWFVFYARNNAFKSYYPMKINSLYKEWLIILLVSIFNITYSLSYYSGKTIKTRTYYSRIETEKKCRIIEMASVFIDGGFENYTTEDYDKNGEFLFQNKKYKQNSLINKSIDNVGEYYSRGQFLENIDKNPKLISSEIQVKTWMQKDNQAEIKKIMYDYFDLIKEHHLESNISPEKWFELTYHFPDFMEYEKIGREKPYYAVPETISNSEVVATTPMASDYDYYIPHNNLKSGYDIISQSWEKPIIDLDLLRILLYVGIGFSLLLFSFKVTSGRSWIIALICVGLLWILTGVISIIIQSGFTFVFFWLGVITFLLIYFFTIIAKNKGKKISDIILNLMLWSFGGFLPAIYGLALEFTDSGYNSSLVVDSPKHTWLENNLDLFSWLNMLIIAILMFFLTIYIKKWKGIAES
jgi:hypothetical protein